MFKIFFLIMLILPRLVWSEWALVQSADGHWISSKDRAQHQLVVARQGDDSQFLLILTTADRRPAETMAISLRIDQDPWLQTQLVPLQQRAHGLAFRIELSQDEKQNTIRRMIAGLKLQLSFGSTTSVKQGLDFSVIGFTAAYTDLLISNDLGRLDPDWLVEQGRDRELACYYSSIFTVQALQARRRGQSAKQIVDSLPRTGLASVDDRRADIVSRAYRLPYAQLPRHPMAEKYKLFKRCMAGS